MKLFVKNGVKYYPIATVNNAQHKLENMECKCDNRLYSIYMGEEKATKVTLETLEEKMELFNELDKNMIVVNVNGKAFYYAPYKLWSFAKEMIQTYDLCH